jgi:AraC-like DNA-binding protein
MDQTTLRKSPPSFANPFQHQMHCVKKEMLDVDIFDTPLPLSSARANPALLSSFTGLFHASWPHMHVVALEGPSIITPLKKRPWLSLLQVVSGEITIHQNNAVLCGSAGDCFFIAQSAALWKSSDYNVVSISVAPEQIFASLKSLKFGDLVSSEYSGGWDLSKPSIMNATDGIAEASMLSTLHHLLTIISELVVNHPHLQILLGITDQLSMLTALIACPELNIALFSERKEIRIGGIEEALNHLIDYMLANLSEPLNLSILEEYSHYSRRSLQYAFRQRFGCTITQWIRTKRLDLAFQKIKAAKIGDSVSNIAHACGYRSSSLFSIEFQSRFHVKPSVMMRAHKNSSDVAK